MDDAPAPVDKLAKIEADIAALDTAVTEFEPIAEKVLAVVGKFSPVAARALKVLQTLKSVL